MESGQVVAGKYRLNQLIGSGGMANVWSATNVFTDRQVAVKFLNATVAKTPEAATRFLKEAKVSARVNHPNVIDTLDVGQTEDGSLFLVMELLTGISLEVALRRQTPAMTLYEFTLVMLDVAKALAAAHRSGVIHRDLKPTNIFLHKVRDGVVLAKVLDFGVSKFLEEDGNHALTVAGTVLGSPLYMSPEQARGDGTIDSRTDIFSFGAMMFEALAGFRAFEAKNFNALIVKIATTRPKSVDEHASYAPESLRAVVKVCLEPDLARRAATFEDVTSRLEALLDELEGSDLRLPVPAALSNPADPDATNALPVVRASDRPHPASRPPPGMPSAPPPPLAITGSSWPSPHTPGPSSQSITTSVRLREPVSNLVAIVGTAIGVVALAVGIGIVISRSRGPVASSPPPRPVATDEAPSADPSPVPAGHGRLTIDAAPGACRVAIDGSAHGATPTAALDLPAGTHELSCTPDGKPARTTSLTIVEGATARYRFTLD